MFGVFELYGGSSDVGLVEGCAGGGWVGLEAYCGGFWGAVEEGMGGVSGWMLRSL